MSPKNKPNVILRREEEVEILTQSNNIKLYLRVEMHRARVHYRITAFQCPIKSSRSSEWLIDQPAIP